MGNGLAQDYFMPGALDGREIIEPSLAPKTAKAPSMLSHTSLLA
jgi:hypothetical protein